VKDAQAHAEEDRRNVERIQTRNEADTFAYQIEKTLRDLGDKAPADIKKDVEEKIAALRETLKGDDTQRIKTAMEELRVASMKIGEAMNQQQPPQSDDGQPQQPEGEPAGATAGEQRRTATPSRASSRNRASKSSRERAQTRERGAAGG
jgi:molecular chaperone DnaK